ncbi:MAG: hypothetical protein K0R50_210 [Eubacterium sp.]|nr:hypothetical protein [Eubacterium sp.]
MRNKAIDCFKGILTIQMIFAHCLQFFVNFDLSKNYYYISEYINLTTFSGFMFAFGFAAYYAYLTKPFSVAYPRILLNSGKTLAAFYISSLAFRIFIEKTIFSRRVFEEILLFKSLAGWSEFLASFTAVMIVLLVFFFAFKKVNGVFVIAAFALSGIMCFIPYGNVHPVAGLFIGGKNFAYFPVFQYIVYFVAGIYFAENKVVFNVKHLLAAIAATSIFPVYTVLKNYPSRFPPSIAWIFGAMLFVYAYYLLSNAVAESKFTQWLSQIGKYSLFYLVLSNVLIFAVKSTGFYRIGPAYATVIFVLIVALIWYLYKLVAPKTAVRPAVETAVKSS